jgi:hypothetical protein
MEVGKYAHMPISATARNQASASHASRRHGGSSLGSFARKQPTQGRFNLNKEQKNPNPPKPKTKTQNQRGKWGKERRRTEERGGEPNASFLIVHKKEASLALRAPGAFDRKRAQAHSSAPRPVKQRINHTRKSRRIMPAPEPQFPPKTTSQRIYTAASTGRPKERAPAAALESPLLEPLI